MDRVAFATGLRRVVPAAALALVVHALFCPAAARPVRVYAFNLAPGTAFTVQLNSNGSTTLVSSILGALVLDANVTVGDELGFIIDENLQPPPPPVITTAEVTGTSCVRVSWMPSGDPTVTGYVVSFGKRSVAGGQADRYEYTVVADGSSAHTACGLSATTYFFAVQAKNHIGQLSAYSAERTATVAPLPVLISSFGARAEAGAVHLSWRVESDEALVGFRVRRARGSGTTKEVAGLIPAGADSWVDSTTAPGTTYTYVLSVSREDGGEVQSAPVSVTTPSLSFALGPTAPNPFRDAARIPLTLDESRRVAVRVYDVRGALVATVFDGVLAAGAHAISWNGRDGSGHPVASGAYFCVMTSGARSASRKMLLVR
jgi:hypothetical protein